MRRLLPALGVAFLLTACAFGAPPEVTVTQSPPAGSTEAEPSVEQAASSPQEQRVLSDAEALRGLLDRYWTRTMRTEFGLSFDAPDRYEFYRTNGNSSCGGKQANALPRNAYYCNADGDEYVAFDLDWFTSYLDEHPNDGTTFLILAHEWGHAAQDTWTEQQPGVDTWSPSYFQELNADCLAGAFLAASLADGTITEEDGDAEAIFGWLFAEGSGEWTDPGDHGTPEQRQGAFGAGFTQGPVHCRTNY